MALTLGNNLTGTVSRTVVESNRKAATLGESMTTGLNQDTQAVDSFLGNSLRDSEKILSAVTKNINYSINMFGTASEYTNILAKSLQEGLTVIGSSGQVSAQKLATLEQGLKDVRAQAALLIKTASFDNKALLTGGVRNLSVQVGLSTVDKLTVGIDNIGEGRLFRSGATKLLIDYFAADVNRSRYYAANQQQLKEDRTDNKNLVIESLEATNPTQTLTDRQLATGLTAIRSNSKGAESTQVLSGVSKHFNDRAKAQLIASWENIFKRDTIFAADANGDAAAHDAAEAIVVGMEQGLDFAQIRDTASEAAKAADNGDGGLDAVRDQARVIIGRYLNGGVAENLGAAIDSHARLVNGTGAGLVADIANPDYGIADLRARAVTRQLAAADAAGLARAGNAVQNGAAAEAFVIANNGTFDAAALAAGRSAAAHNIAAGGTAANAGVAAEAAALVADGNNATTHDGDIAAKAAAAGATAHQINAGATAVNTAAAAVTAVGVSHGTTNYHPSG